MIGWQHLWCGDIRDLELP
uniref:Uncharacterized protein n=1 Tax=Anguilla anguilla TaxID=7936 RepID=A0A0E9UGC2_ANGAN